MIPRPTAFRPGAAVLLGLSLGACSSAGSSSALTADDFFVTTNEMVASLAASEFLADRDATSPPVVIVINKIENLTSDIIPVPEQWALMWRVQSALPVLGLKKSKNVSFMLPPERMKLVEQQRREAGEPPLPAAEPTHEMAATFRSMTRRKMEAGQAANQRMEFYGLGYRIENLASREVVWQDLFEFKRLANGTIID